MPTTNANAINFFSPAKWVVSKVAGEGTHTTITAALAASSAGDTIFIMPGTYTENPTLVSGVNLTAFESDASLNATGLVIINGTCTLSTAGTVTISGMQLQTNSVPCLTVSGSAASNVGLNNCYINATNNTAISFTSSDASSAIRLFGCFGNLATTGIAAFSHSSAGSLIFRESMIMNGGNSTTASTVSGSGNLQIYHTNFTIPISTSSTSTITAFMSIINCTTINTIPLVVAGTGNNAFYNGVLQGGTASAISISTGATLLVSSSTITSNNTNAITGLGSIIYSNLSFTGTSQLINTTTQTGGLSSGIESGNSPSAGFIGEKIEATVGTGTPVSLSSTTTKTVTSISLTAGIWDVSTICVLNGTLQTRFESGCSLVNNTLGAGGVGIDTFDTGVSATAVAGTTGVVPCFRYALATTTTVYLVANATFTGSANASGRISATRVG
jgi:hypothetical protein